MARNFTFNAWAVGSCAKAQLLEVTSHVGKWQICFTYETRGGDVRRVLMKWIAWLLSNGKVEKNKTVSE